MCFLCVCNYFNCIIYLSININTYIIIYIYVEIKRGREREREEREREREERRGRVVRIYHSTLTKYTCTDIYLLAHYIWAQLGLEPLRA